MNDKTKSGNYVPGIISITYPKKGIKIEKSDQISDSHISGDQVGTSDGNMAEKKRNT